MSILSQLKFVIMKEAKCAGSLLMTQEGEINWKF